MNNMLRDAVDSDYPNPPCINKFGGFKQKTGPKTPRAEIVKTGLVIGRNKIPVPEDEVQHLASLGCTDREIAKYFGVTDESLRRNLNEFLIKGRHTIRISIRQAQLRVALEGNPTMLIWLGKNLLSQNENGQDNSDNRPLPWTDEIDNDVDVEDEDDNVDVTDVTDDDVVINVEKGEENVTMS